MTLLLADGTYELRRKTTVKDASMYPVASYPADADWSGDGYSNQKPDRSYVVALDVAAWPVSFDDQLTLSDGTVVVVKTANLDPSDPDPQWDPVRGINCTAVLKGLAQLPGEEQGAEPG